MQPRGPATDAAWTRVDALCADPRFRDCVWRHFRYGGPSARIERLSTVVHPKDRMLHRSLTAFDVNRALSQYFSVALQQHHAAQQVLRALFGDRACDVDVLDFACGYGRAVRFLALAVPGTRIWAADVQREAVEFVTREFRVHGIASSTDPGQFVPARRFGFVRASLVEAAGPDRPWLRVPLALAGHQDLYVVSGGARGLEALSGFRRGPWGFVDRIDLSPSRDLRLEGWAASLDDGTLDVVEIRVDGAAYRCPITLARVDVGAALGDARLALSGWEFRTVLPRTESFVEVAAATSRGESALLYAGPL
jgi:SAM-dependent methyltransferase